MSGTSVNPDNKIVEDFTYVYKPEGVYTLRFFEEPRGLRFHVHEGFRPANETIEKTIQHIEKEFNPLPNLKEPSEFYPNAMFMPDGIPIKFNRDWPLEIKKKFWLATECNSRSISEKHLRVSYEFYKDKIKMYKNMQDEIIKREKLFLYNRDKLILEVQDLIRNNKN